MLWFHDAGRWMWWDSIAADVRYAVRMLAKSPGFSLAVLIALALGIGANTAIFTVVNTVLLRPLPYPDSDRIVTIGRPGLDSTVNIPRFAFWEQNNPGFVDLTAYQPGVAMNLSGGETPELVEAVTASRNYFRLFGANPLVGRTFTATEDRPGGARVLLMSYCLWRRRFGGDTAILGKIIALGGAPYTVIGIISPGFKPYHPAEVWIPLQADPNSTNQASTLTAAARLPDGMTLAQANSEMAVIAERYFQTHLRQIDRHGGIQVSWMEEQITGEARPALLILLGAVGLVLLIACANVANLLLARATSRQREIGIRSAMGAGPRRIVRQLLTESVLLSLTGGVLGLALGSWGVRALLALAPGDLPRVQEMAAIPALDPWVAGFTASLAVVTGLLFGVFPAIQLSRVQLSSTARRSSGHAGTGPKNNRTRGALVAAEVAITVVLLCGALLLIRSFVAMHAVNLGFDQRNTLTMEFALAGPRYAKADATDLFARQFVGRAEAISGVDSAAVASALPLFGYTDMIFDIPGRSSLQGHRFAGDVQWRFVSAHYFDVLHIPLLSGRLFRDREPGRTVVISQTMARRFWPNANAVGQTILIGAGLGPGFDAGATEIVGVAGDVRERLDSNAAPVMYQLPSQIPGGAMALLNRLQSCGIMIRTRPGVDPMSVSRPVQQALLSADGLAATNVRTMERVMLDSTARKNFNLLLLALFAAIALLLAAVGIYAVMSYTVEQRTHEMGIRAALGANRRDTLTLVLLQALRMMLLGVVAGIAASFGLARLLSAQLFGVKPSDPVTFAAVPLVLLFVALVAAGVPAVRAAGVDPVVALRHE